MRTENTFFYGITRLFFIVLALCGTVSLHAQTSSNVTGVVKDAKGEPFFGATVILTGSTIGTTTDYNGNYSINIPADQLDNGTLEFSFIGFKTQNVKVGGRSVIDIILEEDINNIDEIVVVGYGVMRKSDLTGSVSSVRVDDDLAARSNSLDQLIRGRAAGVQILSNSASPDAGVSMRIRGINSFNGQNQPLYVVDGIIINSSPTALTTISQGVDSSGSDEESNGLVGLDPQDIANIEILKDASATAIYGSQGANGVVLITTKSANTAKPKISFSAGVDFRTPYSKMDMLSFDEYMLYIDMLHASAPSVMPDGTYDEILRKIYVDPSTREELLVQPMDWQDYMMRQTVSQRYYFSISGKPKKSSYKLSLGYNNTLGIIKNSGVERYSASFSFDRTIGQNIKIGAKMNLAYIDSDLAQGTQVGRIASSASIMRSMLMTRPWQNLTDDEEELDTDYISGPDKWLKDFVSNRTQVKVSPNVYLNWSITPWLTFRSVLGGDRTFVEASKFKSMRISTTTGTVAAIAQSDKSMYNFDNMFMVNKRFGRHSISGTLGMSMSAINQTVQRTEGWGILQYHSQMESLNTSDETSFGYSKSRSALTSFFVRAIYNYLDRYVLTATYRLDGSSRFKGANKWSSFPSFALAWRVNQESWFNVEAISQLKVRAGWGMVGNQAISNYQTMTNYKNSGLSDHASNSGYSLALRPDNIVNPNLKWETTEQYNAGLDLSLLKGRISFTLDAYYKKTRDLLQEKMIALSSGFSTMWINQGSISNKGLELSAEFVPVATKNIEWTVSGNISFNRNKIVSIGDAASFGTLYLSKGNPVDVNYFHGSTLSSGTNSSAINIFMEGQPMGLFYGYQVDGIVQEGETGPGFSEGETLGPGNYKYVDVDGNGYIDGNDRTVLGDPNPDFIYGFSTALNVKDFSLSVDFTGSYGNDIFNLNNDTEFDTGQAKNNIRRRALVNAWTPENPNTSYRAIGIPSNNLYHSTCVEDGSYLRLSNVAVSYSIPFKVKKAKTRLTLGLSAQNLIVFTKYSGWDPDVNSFGSDMTRMGVDFNSYPQARTFSFDVKYSF